MAIKRKATGKKTSAIKVLVFVLSLFCAFAATSLAPALAEASNTQPLRNLIIGDRVIDNSWTWEYRQGENYSGWGETKPVTWIVVAKDHYGPDSGVTLLSEELIGLYAFDDSTSRGSLFGSNHWGTSGANDAVHGLRPWLNSTGRYLYSGFYYYFSETFKSYVLITDLPNIAWSDGTSYITRDRVFIPSSTELGDIHHFGTRPIGTVYNYFFDRSDLTRIASLGAGGGRVYWTRSPSWEEGLPPCNCTRFIHGVHNNGNLAVILTNTAHAGVRAAVNLDSQTPVSTGAYSNGAYTIGPSTPPPVPQRVDLAGPPHTAYVPGSRVSFIWYSAGGATKYQLQVRKVSNNMVFKQRLLGSETTVTVSGFPNDGTQFKWRVRAGNTSGWGPWSAYRTLVNASLPPAPALRAPANNAAVPGSAVLFRWSSATGATSYQLQIRKKSDNSIFKNRRFVNSTSGIIGGFHGDGTQFKWRVRAGNPGGWGPWSRYGNMTSVTP